MACRVEESTWSCTANGGLAGDGLGSAADGLLEVEEAQRAESAARTTTREARVRFTLVWESRRLRKREIGRRHLEEACGGLQDGCSWPAIDQDLDGVRLLLPRSQDRGRSVRLHLEERPRARLGSGVDLDGVAVDVRAVQGAVDVDAVGVDLESVHDELPGCWIHRS